MEKIWALIKNGVVENTIVADEDFIAAITPNYDFIVRIDGCDVRPGIGMLYDSNTNRFTDLVNGRLIEVINNTTTNVYPIEE